MTLVWKRMDRGHYKAIVGEDVAFHLLRPKGEKGYALLLDAGTFERLEAWHRSGTLKAGKTQASLIAEALKLG